jgi:hypothetical protein
VHAVGSELAACLFVEGSKINSFNGKKKNEVEWRGRTIDTPLLNVIHLHKP